VDTYVWRPKPILHVWMAGLASALVLFFAVLSFVPFAFRGAVQKLLMFGIVVWFVFGAAAMRY